MKKIISLIVVTLTILSVKAQVKPGGTTLDVEFWLKADQMNTTQPAHGSEVKKWLDLSGNNRNFMNGNKMFPSFNSSSLNFNPGLSFEDISNVTTANNNRRKLVAEKSFNTDANKSYYVFWVAKPNLQKIGSNLNGTVFTFTNTTSTNRTSFGWHGSGKIYHVSRGANYLNSITSKAPLGLGVSIIPNDTSTQQQQYFNGEASVTSMSARELKSGSSIPVIGNSRAATYPDDYFYGDIQEIVVLSSAKGLVIAPEELIKVQSYLAIKYGIDLDNNINREYKNSENQTFWSNELNEGYNNNVFGIGRDDSSGLNQKQSENSNNPTMLVFLDELKKTNVENEGVLENKTFLTFGSTNLEGFDEYYYLAGQQFENIISTKDVNQSYKQIYRAQAFGRSSFTVNLKIEVEYVYVLVSNDPTFKPATTRIYLRENDGAVKNVLINDGDYIGIATNPVTPGGTILGVELWLKADMMNKVLPENAENVSSWLDVSGNNRHFENSNSGYLPKFKENSLNFNPALDIKVSEGSSVNNDRRKLQSIDNMPVDPNKAYYFFIVSKFEEEGSGANATVFSFLDNTNVEFGWNKGLKGIFHRNTTSVTHSKIPNKPIGIAAHIVPNVANVGQKQYINGTLDTKVISGTVLNTKGLKSVIGGAGTGSLTTRAFFGEVQEIIVLSGEKGNLIPHDELIKIQSYLAIKYGIDLDKTEVPEYKNSLNQTFWSNSLNSGYTTDIFGIGRDDDTGLYQKQSKNTNENSLVVYLDELKNTNVENQGVLEDKTFLTFGNNNLIGQDPYIYSKGHQFENLTLNQDLTIIQKKIFKAQTLGQESFTVNLAPQLFNTYVLVSQDPSFKPEKTRIYVSDKKGFNKNVLIRNGDYIGFAINLIKPGNVQLDLEYWLKADKMDLQLPQNSSGVKKWIDLSVNARHFINNSNVLPSFNNVSLNYNPSLRIENDEDDAAAANKIKKLESKDPFKPDPNKSYYVFWVSSVDEKSIGTNGTVLSLSNDKTDFGWKQTGSIYHRANGTTYETRETSDKGFGIAASILTNDTSVSHRQYFNGEPSTADMTGILLPNVSVNPIIGNSISGISTKDYFFGEVQEIIVLSSAKGLPISSDELIKVHSYLAIKYGIDLEKTTNNEYKNSLNQTFWSNTANEGYNNNVFGIGRDDLTSLYQKQSKNMYKNSMTIFLGDLEHTNLENSAEMEDLTFLTLGNNNLQGESDYAYSKGHQFMNSKLDMDVEFINKLISKAQTFGKNKFTVNIRPNEAALYMLVSKSPEFTPSSTNIYGIDVEGIARGVEIENGDYIGYANYSFGPAGVYEGMKLWLKADDYNSIDLLNPDLPHNVNGWRDQTSNKNNYSYSAVNLDKANRPTYVACDPRMNFNSSINFKIDDYLAILEGPLSSDSPDDFTSYVVYYNENYTSTERLYTHGFGGTNPIKYDSRYPAMGFQPGKGGGRVTNKGAGTTYSNGREVGFKKGTAAMQMIQTHKRTSSDNPYIVFDFGGWQEKRYPSTSFGSKFRMASGGTLGGASYYNGPFEGLIAEVFFYERALTLEEQNKIRSYLGLKYGITIDEDAEDPLINYDYKLSNNSDVWKGNSLPNQNFHNNVAGIMRDDLADINVAIARSTDDGEYVTIGTKGSEECGVRNYLENDLSSVFWGNNGIDGSKIINYVNTREQCRTFDSRLGRAWLMDKTNIDKESVTIKIGGPSFPFDGSSFKVSMLVGETADDIENNQWNEVIKGEFVNGQHVFNYTLKDKYTFVTFAAEEVSGNCDICTFEGTKKIEFVKNKTWINGEESSVFNLGDDFSATVEVLDTDGVMLKNYSRASARKSLKQLRKGSGISNPNEITTVVTLSHSAATTFELFEIDKYSTRLNNVEIYGMCGGEIVYPMLSYIDSKERSTYSIDENSANAKRKGSSYSSKRGRLKVDFERGVEEIFIVNKVAYPTNATGLKRFGIGSFEFVCPKDVPEASTEGLLLTKRGSTEVSLCEEVEYVFQIYNTNCEEKTVDFNDVLPVGMKWVKESLSLSDELSEKAIINDYGDSNTLEIKGLVISGATEDITFRAKAVFDLDAVAKTYENRATISYDALGVQKTLESCDRLSNGCEPTKTVALASDRPMPIEGNLLIDKSCYEENQTLKVTINLNNPNEFNLSELFLDMLFDENFTFVENSLKSTTVNLETTNITHDDGLLILENLVLPKGQHLLTFELLVPNKNEFLIDPETLLPMPFEISFDLSSDSEDVCLGAATGDVSGGVELPYCDSCTKSPNTDPSQEFTNVGISSFKHQIEGWPENVANGFVVLESSKKGMVMSRTTTIKIKEPVIGMIVYDTDDKCIKLYNGTSWICIQRSCND